jgi:hypothetical protein
MGSLDNERNRITGDHQDPFANRLLSIDAPAVAQARSSLPALIFGMMN